MRVFRLSPVPRQRGVSLGRIAPDEKLRVGLECYPAYDYCADVYGIGIQ